MVSEGHAQLRQGTPTVGTDDGMAEAPPNSRAPTIRPPEYEPTPTQRLVQQLDHLTSAQVVALSTAAEALTQDPASAAVLELTWLIQELSRTDQLRLLAILRVFCPKLRAR